MQVQKVNNQQSFGVFLSPKPRVSKFLTQIFDGDVKLAEEFHDTFKSIQTAHKDNNSLIIGLQKDSFAGAVSGNNYYKSWEYDILNIVARDKKSSKIIDSCQLYSSENPGAEKFITSQMSSFVEEVNKFQKADEAVQNSKVKVAKLIETL